MKRSFLTGAFILLAGCGANLHAVKGDESATQMTFNDALKINDGEAAAAAVEQGHLDPVTSRTAVLARMTKNVREDDVAGAMRLASSYGLGKEEQASFGRTVFEELYDAGLCIRAVKLATTFDLGERYGERAVQCVRKISVIEAGALVCDADVGDAYRKGLVDDAWQSLEDLPTEKRFAMLETLIESDCPLPKARAAAWFPRTLVEPSGLRIGRMLVNKGRVRHWSWDIQAMFRQLLMAAINLNVERQAAEIMEDDAFILEDTVVDPYQHYLIANHRCEDAVKLVLKRKLAFARAESIFDEAKCVGVSFDGLAWFIREDAAQWFDLAMRDQKHRLARRLADKLPVPKAMIVLVETATLYAGDYDALMDFPPHEGETADQQQDRVLKDALDREEEWFVVRWNLYGFNGRVITEVRLNGWIERAYLHALFRKDWRLAASCISKHTAPASAIEGERLAFEEALRAEDANTAIELARIYKLGSEYQSRAAVLKSRQFQGAERQKVKVKARPTAPKDWNP
jgi:hypothetical protein